MSKSILQDWVQALGLRQQGVILTAIRGCDTAPKLDQSKELTRCLRECVLNPHCGDSKAAASFIEWVPPDMIKVRFHRFRRNLDHYPHHYVMHLLHAMEVIGYCHPEPGVRDLWHSFYIMMCQGMHVNHELADQMHKRLNADEATFARHDDAAAYPEGVKAQGGKTKEGWEQYDPPAWRQACEQSARNERATPDQARTREATAEEIARNLT